MSIIAKNRRSGVDLQSVIAGIKNLQADHRADLLTAETTRNLVSLENLSDVELAKTQTTYEAARTALEDCGLLDLVKAHFGPTVSQETIDTAMEAATLTFLASGNPAEYQSRLVKSSGNPKDAVVVDTTVPGIVSGAPSMEAFTNNSFSEFAAMSVVVSALTLTQSDFDEMFFPTEVVPAGQSGATVTLSIPYVFNRTKRAAGGAAFQFEKKPLIHAIEDPTILAGEATRIVPRADAAAGNDAYLVDATVVPNKTVVVNGVDIETRPLVFGKEVDLLSISAHPGLIGSDQQDETDALDPSISIGKVYVKVTSDVGGTPVAHVLEFDVSSHQGALMTRPAEPNGNELTVNYGGRIVLSNATRDIAGADISDMDLFNKLNVTNTDPYSVALHVEINGKANDELGNIKLFANDISIESAEANGVEVAKSSTEFTTLTSDVTVELIGYVPEARRVNANLRMRGIYVDNGTQSRYYYPVQVTAPISSTRPVSADGGGATVEGLVHATRIRSANNAVTTLLAARDKIAAMASSGTMSYIGTVIGANFVRPTLIERQLLVKDEIAIRRSGEGYDDLRSFIVDEITTVVDKLALESGYLSALENFIAGDREYEVILGTDPRIAGLLMVSGDERTLGEKHSYRIASSLDKRVRGKIFISFRRKNKSGMDPLSFGAHVAMPGLVHEVANSSRGGATVQEVQVQARELHTVCLPILGVIDIPVEQLDSYHKRV